MRLIDNPNAQRSTTTIVDTAVLVELLRMAALNAYDEDGYDWSRGQRLERFRKEVERGERVTLRVEDWQEREQTAPARASQPVALPKSQGINPGWRERW